MCYSAQIRQDYRKFVREIGARIDIDEFVRLYWERQQGSGAKIPRAMDAMFAQPQMADERRIADLIAGFDRDETVRLEQLLFKQRQRSEEHTSELQSLMRISYAVFCLKK